MFVIISSISCFHLFIWYFLAQPIGQIKTVDLLACLLVQSIITRSLLYDETHKSFEWLFDTFFKCMSNKQFSLTKIRCCYDESYTVVMPDTHHKLHIWHINQHLSNLSHVLNSKKYFRKEFDFSIYDCEDDEEFFIARRSMLDKYNLCENKIIGYGIFLKLREKWANGIWKQYFSARKKSTQLRESFNACLKNYLKSNLDIVQFFKHF